MKLIRSENDFDVRVALPQVITMLTTRLAISARNLGCGYARGPFRLGLCYSDPFDFNRPDEASLYSDPEV
jgi:hypothetical protein